MASLSNQREGASQAGLDVASPPDSFVLDRRKREEHRCFRGSFLLDKGRVNAKGLGKNSGIRNLEMLSMCLQGGVYVKEFSVIQTS